MSNKRITQIRGFLAPGEAIQVQCDQVNPARTSFNWGSGSPRRHQGKENSRAAGRPGQQGGETAKLNSRRGQCQGKAPRAGRRGPGEGRVGPEQRSSGVSGRAARAPWRQREKVRTGIWEAARRGSWGWRLRALGSQGRAPFSPPRRGSSRSLMAALRRAARPSQCLRERSVTFTSQKSQLCERI